MNSTVSYLNLNYFSKNNLKATLATSPGVDTSRKIERRCTLVYFFILAFRLTLRHAHITSGKSGSIIVQIKEMEGFMELVSTFKASDKISSF